MNRRHFISSSATALAATALSAAESKKKTVWGIAELWQWLYEKQQTSGRDSADCLQAHLDHGIRHVMWALGRSTLDYQSALPNSTMYAGDTRPETKVIGDSFRQECSLRAALSFAEKNNMVIYGRRHEPSLRRRTRGRFALQIRRRASRVDGAASRRAGGRHQGQLCHSRVSRRAHRGAAGGRANRCAWPLPRLLPPAAHRTLSSTDSRSLVEVRSRRSAPDPRQIRARCAPVRPSFSNGRGIAPIL